MKKNMPISGRERVCVQKWVNPIPAGLFLSNIGDGRFIPPLSLMILSTGVDGKHPPPSLNRVKAKNTRK